MKKLLMAIAILSSTLFMTGCGGSSDPKATLTGFFDALGKKDMDGARKLATADSKSMIDMLEMGMKMSKDSAGTDSKYDKSKMEFGDAKIEGDKATVPVKDKASGETTNFTLKKEGGAWKVAFDKASMMEMGTQKMKDKGEDPTNEMKDVNMDSLNKAMEQGLKALDSAKELLKDVK